MPFIPGTPASEVLIGTPEDDQIAGFEGDDLLNGDLLATEFFA